MILPSIFYTRDHRSKENIECLQLALNKFIVDKSFQNVTLSFQ